jgi:hypothetical protein
MDALPAILKASPEVYPHALDPVGDGVAFVRLSREALAAASFLDERVLAGGKRMQWRPWAEVEEATAQAGLIERCGFIFHIGHVGSTLLSRLMGAHATVLSLREPLPLRTLAQAGGELASAESLWSAEDLERRLSAMLKLWSRTFEPGQLSVVKATSFCSEMAEGLLARPGAVGAVLMYSPPEAYLANLFAGANNRLDVRALASARLKRLHRRIGEAPWRLSAMSYPEMAAMTWACEMSALAAAAGAHPARIQWLDFERLLLRPQSLLAAGFGRFGLGPSAEEIAALVAGPEMGRYSKAPEHAYDSSMRSQVLTQSRQEHRAEIREALGWLQRAGAYPAIAAALGAAS